MIELSIAAFDIQLTHLFVFLSECVDADRCPFEGYGLQFWSFLEAANDLLHELEAQVHNFLEEDVLRFEGVYDCLQSFSSWLILQIVVEDQNFALPSSDQISNLRNHGAKKLNRLIFTCQEYSCISLSWKVKCSATPRMKLRQALSSTPLLIDSHMVGNRLNASTFIRYTTSLTSLANFLLSTSSILSATIEFTR